LPHDLTPQRAQCLAHPISRVRSVTEIIMIATTPIPPTIRPTIDNATIRYRATAVKLLIALVYTSW